jgi:putative ABC transport system permease protein
MNSMLWRASYRFLLRHPWQLGLAILGIALGVAIIVAVDLARASAKAAFEHSTEAVVGKATHRIIGGPEGLDESLYVRLRMREDVRPLAPVIEGHVTLPTLPGETLQLLGVDPFAEASFRDYWKALRADANSGIDVGDLVAMPGAVAVSEATRERLGLKPGSTFTIRIGRVERNVQLLGVIKPAGTKMGDSALDDLLFTDIATAQELLAMQGRLSHIDLIIPEGVDEEAYVKRLKALLPPGADLIPAGNRSQALTQMTHAFHANLTASSLLALLVGAFLIYNTMSFVVVQQRPLIGTLRTLGVTRRQVFRGILGQAMIIGAIGTAAGLALGMGLGPGLTRLVTRTINDIYFTLTVRQLSLDPFILAKGIILGVAATLAAALMPAHEATSVTPRQALTRSQLESKVSHGLLGAAFAGVVMVALGGGIILWSGKSMVFGFIALFAVIFGCALLTPLATVGSITLLRPLVGRWFGVLGQLSSRAVTAALSRTAVAIAALMVAIAAIVSIGLMIASFRIAVVDWLQNVLRADMYISLPGPRSAAPVSTIDPELARRLAEAPGVAAVSTVRWLEIELQNNLIKLIVYAMVPNSYAAFRFKEGDPARIWPAFEHGGAVLISEAYAYHHGLHPGATLGLRTDQGMRDFPIAGVYYEYSSDQGVIAMSRRTFERYWNDRMLTSLGIYAAPGVDDTQLRATVQRLIEPEQALVISSSRSIREASMKIFDRSFAITEVLRLLAALVAFVGIVSALMALQLERTRELGVLRAIGVTPRQLWRLVMVETGLMGLIAGLLALPVGTVTAALLILVLNQRSFGWSMDLQISPEILLQGLALAIAAALLAGVYPALKMARTSPAEALRTE